MDLSNQKQLPITLAPAPKSKIGVVVFSARQTCQKGVLFAPPAFFCSIDLGADREAIVKFFKLVDYLNSPGSSPDSQIRVAISVYHYNAFIYIDTRIRPYVCTCTYTCI